jgi:hypothetical protein
MVDVLGGDLADAVEKRLVNGVADQNVSQRLALHHKVAEIRKELEGERPTAVERLLCHRVALCWLEAHKADLLFHKGGQTFEQARFALGVQNAAHKRYLSALRELAQVRKLAVPVLIGQVNVVASRPVHVGGGG